MCVYVLGISVYPRKNPGENAFYCGLCVFCFSGSALMCSWNIYCPPPTPSHRPLSRKPFSFVNENFGRALVHTLAHPLWNSRLYKYSVCVFFWRAGAVHVQYWQYAVCTLADRSSEFFFLRLSYFSLWWWQFCENYFQDTICVLYVLEAVYVRRRLGLRNYIKVVHVYVIFRCAGVRKRIKQVISSFKFNLEKFFAV